MEALHYLTPQKEKINKALIEDYNKQTPSCMS